VFPSGSVVGENYSEQTCLWVNGFLSEQIQKHLAVRRLWTL